MTERTTYQRVKDLAIYDWELRSEAAYSDRHSIVEHHKFIHCGLRKKISELWGWLTPDEQAEIDRLDNRPLDLSRTIKRVD